MEKAASGSVLGCLAIFFGGIIAAIILAAIL